MHFLPFTYDSWFFLLSAILCQRVHFRVRVRVYKIKNKSSWLSHLLGKFYSKKNTNFVGNCNGFVLPYFGARLWHAIFSFWLEIRARRFVYIRTCYRWFRICKLISDIPKASYRIWQLIRGRIKVRTKHGSRTRLCAKTRNIVGVKSNENIASGDGLLFWGRILKARVTLRIGNQNIILHSNKNVPNH